MPNPEAKAREKIDVQLIAFGPEHADLFRCDFHPDIHDLEIDHHSGKGAWRHASNFASRLSVLAGLAHPNYGIRIEPC